MKSPDPLDPQRLEVVEASVHQDFGDARNVMVTVILRYEPWWDEPGQDVLYEQANALTCVRQALRRGRVGHDF